MNTSMVGGDLANYNVVFGRSFQSQINNKQMIYYITQSNVHSQQSIIYM